MRFLVSTHDKSLGRETFSTGAYELPTMDDAVNFATNGGLALRGKVFVDVGANIGTTTVPALLRYGAAKVIAIEPEPENYTLLRCNIILNGLEDRAICVQAAVTDVIGALELELSATNSGDHRIRDSKDDGEYQEATRPTIEVPGRTLDSILAENGVAHDEVGLIWIDTQGYEAHVLASTEIRGVPVVIEYWPYGLRRTSSLTSLHEEIRRRFSLVRDVRSGRTLEAKEVAELEQEYLGRTYTDLVLIP